MTRTLAHSLQFIAVRNDWSFNLWSAYDHNEDLMPQYLSAARFFGFGANRTKFVFKAVTASKKPDVIIISHINLAIVGIVIKLLNPNCRVWLIAHGIEVWRVLSKIQRNFLKRCDKIVCVSEFTKLQMIKRHGLNPALCEVLNNVIDPFIKLPHIFTKPDHLLKQHRLLQNTPVIFTLTRLASTEQYKGHDQVIKTISSLKEKYPGIKYILAGQYDHKEEIRIQKLISSLKVDEQVILTGFIDEAEIKDYFLLADVFVLPSKKEGFGIVFIEALACGLPVICGNSDGSLDAIRNGELGRAVDPDNLTELEEAICSSLQFPLDAEQRRQLQQRCLSYFNENNYANKLNKMIG